MGLGEPPPLLLSLPHFQPCPYRVPVSSLVMVLTSVLLGRMFEGKIFLGLLGRRLKRLSETELQRLLALLNETPSVKSQRHALAALARGLLRQAPSR